MKNLSRVFLGLILLCGMPIPQAAHAGVNFDFLFSANSVTDDNQFYLNLAVSNYGYPRTVIEPVLPRVRYVEQDLPVILFLANVSGRPVDAIVDLRYQGLGWSVIFSRVGVPYDVLFVDLDRDPGPPYGKAWGHWKKNPKRCILSDGDIVNLVNVQVGHRVSGMSVYDVARARSGGKSIATVVADKKGRPHGNANHSPKSASLNKKNAKADDGELAAQSGSKHDGGKGAGKSNKGGGKNGKDH
jgi:hypothetical protein